MRYKKDYGTCQAPAITDQDGVFVAMMFNEGELSNQLEEADAEKALSLLTAAPELLEACKSAEQALKDIIGAADNNMPYTRDELVQNFMDDYNKVLTAIYKAEGA